MANITLPSNPVNGQTVVIGTRLFQYDSTANRWKSRVFQVLGDTSVTVTNEAPTITASLSEIALDTSGANVSFAYTVSDVDSSILKVSHSVSGIANSDLATVTHHRANNTVTITSGTENFTGGQITLTVTDGRNNATDTVDVSAAYPWTVNLSNVTYDNVSLSTTGSEANAPFGLSFSNDGANMYITGTSGDRIYQYTLSTPWDLSTATYSGQSPVTIASNPYGCFINSDGTKIFGLSQGNIRVHEFNLSTAYDITTASGTVIFNIPEDIAPRDITFSRDGTKLFVASQTPSAVYRYDLSTPWDLSTAPAAASSSMGAPSLTWAIGFNSDGTKIYLGSITSDLLYRYDLSTPYDLSTASFDHSIDISSEVASVKGIAFKYDDGSKMYLADYDDDHVYQYSTGL